MNRPLRIGGVMRCCEHSLIESSVNNEEDNIIPCLYCDSALIFREGAWEWHINYVKETQEKQ